MLRVCYPQSNGKLERFHSTLKTEHVRKTPYFSYEDAKEKMAQWINFYNNERLHGALLYLTPEDYFAGRKEKRLAEIVYNKVRNFFEKSHANQAAFCSLSHSIFCSRRVSALM
ncbi:MAG: integrase core domain-containing protein [Treponemataceae bacterium]|nr:integrase core domain-containing protein [Treponemataceae bacterium]